MPNPTPAMPPVSPQPPRRAASAYDVILGAVIVAFILACFAALMAVGTLMATARPVMRWRVAQPPVVATTPTDPSGWQTYRNEEYGFEVKYPESWITTAHGIDVTRRLSPSEVSVTLSTGIMGPTVSYVTIRPRGISRFCPVLESCPGPSTVRTIAGKSADIFDTQSERPFPSSSRVIVFQDPKTEYAEFQIEMYAAATGKIDETLKTHEEILQTFRFIPTDDLPSPL